jgi:hypothetical protein
MRLKKDKAAREKKKLQPATAADDIRDKTAES